jgi:DNA-binding transcriptional LysR family regulator
VTKTDSVATTHDRQASESLHTSESLERFFRNRLRLSQLRVLVAIADLGQLRKVADQFSVTPAAISKQISEVEDALQRPVLRRVGNGVAFTEIGELLVRRARAALDQLERARVEIDELCSGLGGRVGIGAVSSVAPLFLPPLVMALKQRAPSMAILLQEAQFERLAPLLEDSTLDIVLARETTHRLTPSFRQRDVLADPIAIVCGSQHALAGRGSLTWSDLEGSPWILPARGSTTLALFERLAHRHRLSIPSGSVESMSWRINVELLQSYPFLTLMPLAYARKYLTSGCITVLPLSTEGMLGTVKAVWRRDNENPAIILLLEAIEQQAAQLQ